MPTMLCWMMIGQLGSHDHDMNNDTAQQHKIIFSQARLHSDWLLRTFNTHM